jgi:predicted O-methyltransferase YrrM
MRRVINAIKTSTLKKQTHGDLIEKLLSASPAITKNRQPVFVETGCGISTISLGKAAQRIGAIVYSCDYNQEKSDELKSSSAGMVKNVEFMIGDSLQSLASIASRHDTIDFLFLDSAASAMHTFREFITVEKCLKPGSQILIDNAAIPGTTRVLSPVRKGKILVPYLLASPFWKVTGYPGSGDSMVGATLHIEPDYADPDYEDPEYIDNWRSLFKQELKK